MSATVNKSVPGVQTRFKKRSQPTSLTPQVVTRKSSARNPAESVRKVSSHNRLWRGSRQTSNKEPNIEDDISEDNMDSETNCLALEEGDRQVAGVKNDVTKDSVEDFDSCIKEKSKSEKHLRTLVNRLAPTPGFVDKNSLPSNLHNRSRVRRLASLNAAAKVNVLYEPSSTLAGRSLTDIMQHSKKIHGGEGGGSAQIADEKENALSKTKNRIESIPVLKYDPNYLESPGLLFDSMNASIELSGETLPKTLVVIKRENENVEEQTQTKRTRIDENGRYATIIGNKRFFRGKEVVDVGLQVEIPKIIGTTKTYCKCRPSKIIDVPIQSYVTTYTNGTLVSIPITKTHRLTPRVPDKPAPELAQGDLACRSKRIAGLNSRAMLNAILAEERTIPSYHLGASKYSKSAKKEYYEHGLNNTVPSLLKIPKINFAATSTSNFGTFSRGKAWASHLVKSPLSQKSGMLSHDGPKRTNGWFFLDPPMIKPYYYGDFTVTRKYYSGIKRNNEVICVRDSVLLKSGPRRKDLPFVARVSGFWEEMEGPHAGEMMMSVLWYYRPEQTEIGNQPDIHGENEILASRHKDDNSVACIVDKCYVLSYPEYCRYRASVKRSQDSRVPSVNPVPPGHVTSDQTPLSADPKLVFFCRQIYDYRMGRIMKNPLIYNVN